MYKYFIIFIFILSFSLHASDCGKVGSIDQRIKDCSNNKYFNKNFLILTKDKNREFLYEIGTNNSWSYEVESYKECVGIYNKPKKDDILRVKKKGLLTTDKYRCVANLKDQVLIDLRSLRFDE